MVNNNNLLNEWKRIFENKPDISSNFSEEKSFKKFVRLYLEKYRKNIGMSKVSEPYFRLFISELIKDLDHVKVEPKHHRIELPNFKNVKKSFDIAVEINNVNFLIELKKNIDMIEKDIFKWILIKDEKKYKKIQIIWEQEDRSLNKDRRPNQYMQFLDYAKDKGWIDDYFYFLPTNFESEKERLRRFFIDACTHKDIKSCGK